VAREGFFALTDFLIGFAAGVFADFFVFTDAAAVGFLRVVAAAGFTLDAALVVFEVADFAEDFFVGSEGIGLSLKGDIE
jgi:hypothetical protein